MKSLHRAFNESSIREDPFYSVTPEGFHDKMSLAKDPRPPHAAGHPITKSLRGMGFKPINAIMKRLFIARKLYASFTLSCLLMTATLGEVRLPSIFGNHMVLQREQAHPIWGWADAHESITILFEDQRVQTQAAADGGWKVTLNLSLIHI